MKKLFTIYAIALFAVFSCTVPEEQIPEEIINPEEVEAPVVLQSILPDEMTISSDGAPSTKAGAIDAYDDQLLSGALGEEYTESLKNKVFWDNGDRIDFFGYSGGQFCNMVYETSCYGDNIQSRVSNVTIRRITDEGSVITAPLSIPDQGDVRSDACIAIYPAGIVYNGESGLSGAWDPEGCTLKLNLPNHYDLDPESRAAADFNVVRGMKLQAPMLGFYFMNGGTNFYHLGGILKVNFSGIARGVKYFKVTTPGKKINGEFVISVSADENNRPYIALVDTETESEQTIKFEYPDGEWANAINFNHDLYIPLPVGIYDQISVDVYDSDDVILGHWETSNFEITRGKLKFISSYAVEDIIKVIEDVTDTNISVSQSGDRAGKGVAVDFDAINNSSKDYTLYYDGAGKNPKNVYVTGGSSTHVGIISGDLGNSTVDFIGGTFEGSALTTAANTLNIRKGATVKTISIKGGNAKVAGGYKDIVVDKDATADGVSAPVTVTIKPTATVFAGTPSVTINAPTNLVIAKPEGTDSEHITSVNVVVAATETTTTGTAVSNITVGENVNVHIVAATGTDVNIETVDAKTNTDADGAITIDPETQGDITSVWDGTSKSPLTQIDDNTFGIYTAAQLAQLAEDVNSKTNYYAGKTVKLMCNIDLDNEAWTPIGLGGENATDDKEHEVGVFLGTFDGNGKTISNLNATHDNDDRSFAGLFGNITSIDHAVTIQNLTVSGVDIHSEHMAAGILGRYCGAGNSASLVINNCRVVGTDGHNTITSVPFEHDNISESGNQAAGIVGNAYGKGTISITNCSVDNVNINGTRDLGGIAGFLDKNNVVLTNNAVSNTTITQSYPNDYESGKDMTTVHEFVGRTFVVDENSNTATNVTIILQGGEVVTRIGNTNYTSLVDAVAAATDGATITLLADIDFSVAPYADYKWGDTYNPLEICGNNITLDLNGHTISEMGNCGIVFGKIYAKDGRSSNVTIKNGTLLAGKTNNVTNSYVLCIAGIDGATIKNVTTNGGINVFTGSTNVVIEDCDVNGTKFYTVCAQSGSDVTIKGTSFTKNVDASVATPSMFWVAGAGTDSDCVTTENPTGAFGPSSIVIEGGEYTIKSGGAFYLSGNGYLKPTVIGGIFNINPSACVAEGYEAVDNGNGTWTVQESTDVAEISGDKYQTLAAAVAAATSGQTIKILKNFTIEGNAGVEIPAGKTITLDLNGKTISQTAPDAAKSYVIWNKGTLTITDTGNGGTLECTINQPSVGWNPGYANNVITNDGTLAIDAGNLVNHSGGVNPVNVACYAIDHYASNTLTVNGGNLVSGYAPIRSYQGTNKTVAIHGGTLTGLWPIYLQYPTTLIIDGGTINGPDRGIVYADEPCIVSVSDGTFNYSTTRGFIEFDTTAASEGTNASITGGTFSNNPSTWVAAGYESYQDGNVWKIREVQGVAQIGNVTYETLAAAVSDAEDGATIKVIKAGDYAIPAITKNLTFDAIVDGVVVNHNSNATAIATITSDKKATFKKITFNLGNSYYHGFGTQNNATSGELELDGCTIDGSLSLYGVSTLKNCTFTATGANAGYYNIWAVLKDATFTNCTFTNTNRAVNVYDFKHTTNPKNVSFSGCTFTATGNEKKKAAINIHHNPDANQGFDAAKYNVSITNCTAAGSNWATSVADTGEPAEKTVCSSALWMISDIVSWTYDDITVKVNDVKVTIINEAYGGGEPEAGGDDPFGA